MARRSIVQSPSGFRPDLRTVGAMKAAGERIKAWCHGGCGKSRMVDLDRIIAAKGVDYSLINRRCRCTLTQGCQGWVRFHYYAHGCLRDLSTEPQMNSWIDRDYEARMAEQGRAYLTAALRGTVAETAAKKRDQQR